MQRILMRGHKSPFRAASARETLRQNLIGNNVGNLIFAESSFRLLNTSRSAVDLRRLNDLSADVINDSYDAVVIPLANAFRASFVTELRRMTSLIQRLTVPVVVLGVGAQANLGADQRPGGDIDADVQAFVAAVLDRSASIGVRGEVTASYLAGLGFGSDVVDVIGCPSMFMRGPQLAIKKRPEGDHENLQDLPERLALPQPDRSALAAVRGRIPEPDLYRAGPPHPWPDARRALQGEVGAPRWSAGHPGPPADP